MAKIKFKDIFTSKDNYDTIVKTIWIIPLIIGFTKYTLRDKEDARGFYLVGFSINIFLLELRLFLFGHEHARAGRAKRNRKKPLPMTITVCQSKETGKCMFIRSGYGYGEYWDTAEGFDVLKTIYASNEAEMIQKLKEYESETGRVITNIEG